MDEEKTGHYAEVPNEGERDWFTDLNAICDIIDSGVGSRDVLTVTRLDIQPKPRRLHPYGMPTAAAMETFDRIRANLALAAAGNERLTNYLTMDWDGAVTVSDPEVNEALVMTTMRRLTQ